MGRTKPILDAFRPAGGRAHCLRFAHPAEADWRLEARKLEDLHLSVSSATLYVSSSPLETGTFLVQPCVFVVQPSEYLVQPSVLVVQPCVSGTRWSVRETPK